MVEFIQEFWYFITHLNETLPAFIAENGNLVYALLFLIIFVETGLVIMPFLPGDSLLFVAGSLAAGANPSMNLWILIPLLIVAAILGDNLNYVIGRYFGDRVVQWKLFGRNLVRQKDLDKTQSYFEKYGPRTIIIARFVPIVRTLAPFAAGVGRMDHMKQFTPYNVIGAFIWIILLTVAGYAFGTHPFVQKHYETVILGIIFISVLPMVVEVARAMLSKKKDEAPKQDPQ